ncbi:hypothetical protein V1477_020318, partial [Vespula maculifrons]
GTRNDKREFHSETRNLFSRREGSSNRPISYRLNLHGLAFDKGGESTPPREISSEKPAGIASSEQELSPAVNLDINQRRHTASEETR